MTAERRRVAVITGAARGQGRGAALALARDGLDVAIFDLNEDGLRETAGAARELGAEVSAQVVDVRSEEEISAALGRVAAELGGVDVLVNNAGVIIYTQVPDTSLEQWQTIINTNLRGMFLMCKHTIPLIRERGGGAIVNLASVGALAGTEGIAVYAASKGGVVAMTRVLAIDHGPEGIRVNAVAPGSVRTPMLEAAVAEGFPELSTEEALQHLADVQPIRRVVEPSDVGELVAFLASDRAAMITGTVQVIDGGMMAKLAN